ncbi:MAG: AAA family ATPase [Deltaproteobacteria bacterium]|nr:AAA family ATPase [Deltaproteobacteria bacterium]
MNTQGYFYCDRTDKINLLEKSDSQLFIRPRRFGKSLVLSMIENYYDVAKKDEFEAIFGGLITLAVRKITADGILIIKAERFRTQSLNRQDAINRLTGLIREALKEPKIRKKTKPSASSKRRMLDAKRHRSKLKRLRRPAQTTDD